MLRIGKFRQRIKKSMAVQIYGNLKNIKDLAKQMGFKSPAILTNYQSLKSSIVRAGKITRNSLISVKKPNKIFPIILSRA